MNPTRDRFRGSRPVAADPPRRRSLRRPPRRRRTRASWSWVPIRSLGPRHRERIVAHLLALDERSRYLRFGYPATDGQIRPLRRHARFRARRGVRHLQSPPRTDRHGAPGPPRRRTIAQPSAATSEFGVSVLPQARRRGFGRRLFEHAMLHARNRGVETMFIHALSENTAMLKIARDAGAMVQREGSESDAWLELPPDSLASHLDELLGDRAAELDYRLKEHAHQVGRPAGRDRRRRGNEPFATRARQLSRAVCGGLTLGVGGARHADQAVDRGGAVAGNIRYIRLGHVVADPGVCDRDCSDDANASVDRRARRRSSLLAHRR